MNESIWHLSGAVSENESESTPRWLNRALFPFDPQYLSLPEGRVHYVDEGEGPTVLMLHGNPTWSFLYRHVIRGLSADYRCVALDYLGFGRSDAPEEFSYRPADHARVVEAFVEELDLRDVTLVVQDWGGPIGLSYATTHPENVRAVVAMNTWMWPLDGLSTRLFSRLLGSRLGKRLIERTNLFARWVMPAAYADRSKLTPDVHRHYLRPLDTPTSRRASWVFPHELRGSREWLAGLWERRDAIADTPMLLLWGTDDPAFASTLPRWRASFPAARVVEYDDCGHYVQEERGKDVAEEIRAFLGGLDAVGEAD